MSDKQPSHWDQIRTALLSNPAVRVCVGAIKIARAIAHSQGGRDLGAWLSYGRYELASVMMHGYSSIYPGRNSHPGEQTPDFTQLAPVVVTSESPQPDAAQSSPHPMTEEQMTSLKSQANVAYAMSQADRMNVNDLKFDVANIIHSGPLTPRHLPETSEVKAAVQPVQPAESLIDQHLERLRGPESIHPELSREAAAPNVAPAESIVDRHLENLENTIEPASPVMELDVDR